MLSELLWDNPDKKEPMEDQGRRKKEKMSKWKKNIRNLARGKDRNQYPSF